MASASTTPSTPPSSARGAAQDTDLDAAALREVADAYKKIVREATGRDFPADPYEQLDLAIKAVFASWFGKRAHDYRENQKIAHDLGTAVNVVTMVYGNMGDDSGTGVAFTRDPNTGEKVLYGEYLTNAQGEDVVAGIRTPQKISHLAQDLPAAFEEFQRIAERLERHYRDVQDLEFTIERGRLFMLQTRSAKRTAAAAVRIAVDMVGEGIITEEEAIARIEPAHVDQLLRDQFDPKARTAAVRAAQGLNASPGAAVGRAVFSADDAVDWVQRGETVVLVRIETSPDDFHGMAVAQGILTARGGATSHAAVVARQIGKPCVAGCAELVVDYGAKTAHSSDTGASFAEGDWISVDGSTGEVFLGKLPTVSARYEDQHELQTILGYADKIRRMGVWTNADKPEEAAQARSYGAQGIGLCRTEHMFREGDRLEIVRGAILVANQATRAKARLAAGETLDADERDRGRRGSTPRWPSSRCSSRATSRASSRRWTGCRSSSGSSTRRSTSSCPTSRTQLVKVDQGRRHGDAPRTSSCSPRSARCTSRTRCSACAAAGSGLMIPDFVKIQTRAILNAQIAVKRRGGHPIAKIMIPLVGHVNELAATRRLLEAEATAVEAKAGVKVDYKFGTMIEVPRGALTADEIAREADFFSFGTNDLTQMTFGYSRDDAEGGFLLKYVEDKILPFNPFQTLDDAVVGLMKIAVEKGRVDEAGHRARHLRRARRRPRVDRQVRADRPRLRELLAVPRPGGPPRGGPGGPRLGGRTGQVGDRSTVRLSAPRRCRRAVHR